jgi:hypothetical protein
MRMTLSRMCIVQRVLLASCQRLHVRFAAKRNAPWLDCLIEGALAHPLGESCNDYKHSLFLTTND